MKLPALFIVTLLPLTQAGAADMWTGMYEEQLRSARNGDVEAQYNVAGMYKNGQGTTSDREKALYWYTRAAEQNHEHARGAIALMKSNERRFGKTLAAARRGNMQGEYKLASMYESGKGTNTDLDQARHWYTIAAEKGHARAQYGLARLFYDNPDKTGDRKIAFRWFLDSAEQGYSPAQYYLAEMYLNGQDVEQDPQQALHWYKKAAEGGYGPAYKGVAAAEQALDKQRQHAARIREEALVKAMLSAEEEHAKAISDKTELEPAPISNQVTGSPVKKSSTGGEETEQSNRPLVTADSIKEIILNGNWMHGKAPAVFLPSSVNTCADETARVVCTSEDLNPTSDGRARYRVKSIITGIEANGSFTVVFRRLNIGSVIDPGWTGEESSPGIQARGWSAAANLQCRLQKGLSIDCQNSLGKTTEFQRSTQTAKR